MLQMQCDSVDQRIGLMMKAGQLERKTHSQRQVEIAEMELQRVREQVAEREEEGKRQLKKGGFVRHTPDRALLEFRARKAGEALPAESIESPLVKAPANGKKSDEQPSKKVAGKVIPAEKAGGNTNVKVKRQGRVDIPPLSESNAIAPPVQKKENGRSNEHKKPSAAKQWKGKEGVMPAVGGLPVRGQIGGKKTTLDVDPPGSGKVQNHKGTKNRVPQLVLPKRDSDVDDDDDTSNQLMEDILESPRVKAPNVDELGSPNKHSPVGKPPNLHLTVLSEPEGEIETSNSVDIPSVQSSATSSEEEVDLINEGKGTIVIEEYSDNEEPDIEQESTIREMGDEIEEDPSEPVYLASDSVGELSDD
jgi:hypothetical protein